MPFKDILGHEREIGILKKALSHERVPHSFLFIGPEGIGKRLTALSLAKSLNCSTSKDDFCGFCQNCKDIDRASYPDVFLVEPREPESKGGEIDHVTGTIKIDAVRDIQQRLSYKAIKGGKKVCIVDGIEKMNKDAQNAFLKTLEEPPADSIIILIESDGATLLPTIVSRCQRINFRPLSSDVMAGIIKKRLGVTEEKAILFSSLSGGSIGRVFSWDPEAILEQRKKVVEMLLQLSLHDVEGLFKIAEDIAKGESPVETLEFLKIWYRDMTVCKEGMEDMVVNSDLLPVLKKHTQGQTFSKIISGFKAILNAQADIMPPRYANKQLTVENLLMQLAS